MDRMEVFTIALEIMWKGMLGIFTASLVILLVVLIMSKITWKKKEN